MRQIRFLVLFGLLLLSVTACLRARGGSFDPEGVVPASGWWRYFDDGIVENSCGSEELYHDPDASFGLYAGPDGGFRVDQGDTWPDFDCALDRHRFDCPQRHADSVPLETADATLSYAIGISGDFESHRALGGLQRVDITCEGSACGLAPLLGWTLPCHYTVAFHATAY